MAKKIEYLGKRKSSELKASETEKIDRYKERFNKWHAKQINLLTFSINLIFTISIAFLGFIIGMLSDKCSSGGKEILIVLGITVSIGILALITRLNDFRVTKNITKSRRRIYELKNEIQYEDTEASNSTQLEKLLNKQRCWTSILGKTTWILFYLQIASLLLALWMLILQ
jgi:hypothetical protein